MRITSLLFLINLVNSFSHSRRATKPFNVASPGATPIHVVPPSPRPLSISALDIRLNRISSISSTTRRRRQNFNLNCLDSSADDTVINSLLYHGGANFKVVLCPNATIPLRRSPVYFTAAGQEVSTEGYPTDSTRATLIVASPTLTTAVYGVYDDHISLRNVQINGNRAEWGYAKDGNALIEMGGDSVGQIIDSIRAFDPRGWSVLYGIEGNDSSCRGMKITNNQIGPSGHAPSGSQFKKRDSSGLTYQPGEWADGISLACPKSVVTGNTITDATDGMIVCFTCQSLISSNTIISSDRQALGGINLVDFGPNHGNYTGTNVSNNHLIAQSNFIKVGIALGTQTWDDQPSVTRNFGGVVSGNRFSSGKDGYFGFAIAVAGQDSATVSQNLATNASFGGNDSPACVIKIPTSQAFVIDPATSKSMTVQPGFVSAPVKFLICQRPGPIILLGINLLDSNVSASNISSNISSITSSLISNLTQETQSSRISSPVSISTATSTASVNHIVSAFHRLPSGILEPNPKKQRNL